MNKNFNRAAVAGSALFHLFLVLWLGTIQQGSPPKPQELTERKRVITHLIDPPTELTQRAPNKAPLSKELVAEAILPRPQLRRPAPAATSAPPRQPERPQAAPEPPKIQIAAAEKAQLPQAIPPPPPPVEKPKLTFENVQPQAAPVAKVNANPALTPQNPIQEAMRNIARSGPSGSQAVGDATAELENTGPGLNLPPSAGRPRSSLELKSDPMGVDFKPYLVRVLATVRRNWFAIYPEAARLGQRGRVLVEFAVARTAPSPRSSFLSSPVRARWTKPLWRRLAPLTACRPCPPISREPCRAPVHLLLQHGCPLKFWIAMSTYVVVAIIAAFWIDGTLRTAVWILMGGLAAKTLVATKM